jgi:FkbM family methyltransferase
MTNIKAYNNALYDHECYMRLGSAPMQEIPVPFIGTTIDYDRIGNAAALAFQVSDENAQGAIRSFSIDGFSLDNVGLIKCDAQGSDYYVLKGAAKTIARCRPVIVFEYEEELSRLHDKKLADFEDYFEVLGYDVKLLAAQCEGKQSDYIATPRLKV